MKIAGLVGSLREGSFNKALMQQAVASAPEGIEIVVFEKLGEIPPFNQDILDKGVPPVVAQLKNLIKSSDAVLVATPEYNYSIPGVLKNAIDWASRPYGDNSFEDKPLGIMSASGGMLGGAKAQFHLRQIVVFLNMHPLNKPEVVVTFAGEKIQEGKVVDAHTKEKILELVKALVAWTKRLGK